MREAYGVVGIIGPWNFPVLNCMRSVLAALVCDEEFASIGAQDFVRRYHSNACIVTEPSDLKLVLAHKGFVWFELKVAGRGAHGSRWDLGDSAIARMARLHESVSPGRDADDDADTTPVDERTFARELRHADRNRAALKRWVVWRSEFAHMWGALV